MVTQLTRRGELDILNPQIDDIHWEDIAIGLSRIPRWLGQTTHTYSVAEHSIMVACQCSDELRLWGLLHDAAETYFGDVSAKQKALLWFHIPGDNGVIRRRTFEDVEEDVLKVILAKAGIDVAPGAPALPQEVRDADLIIRKRERTNLVRPKPGVGYTPLSEEEAAEKWLDCLERLLVLQERQAALVAI